MAETTKACSLTEEEVKNLIVAHSIKIANTDANDADYSIERLNYLNKRLKAFSEGPENPPKSAMTDTQADAINAASATAETKASW